MIKNVIFDVGNVLVNYRYRYPMQVLSVFYPSETAHEETHCGRQT